MTCEWCHPYCRDCDGSRTHYISLRGQELVGCGCSGCCDRLGGSGPYLRDAALVAEVITDETPCDRTFIRCSCALNGIHELHECACTGSWSYDEAGREIIHSLPNPFWAGGVFGGLFAQEAEA